MHPFPFFTFTTMAARSLQELLASGDATNPLGRLSVHGELLLNLQRKLEAALPEALRPHVRIANLRPGKLMLHASNAAVAAKLRQIGPRLTEQLSNDGAKLNRIEVKVQARQRSPVEAEHIRPILPGLQQKRGLTNLSQRLPEASPLKDALQRLLKTLKE